MREENVTDYWSSVKEIIDKICKDYDKLWKRRDRILNSKIIINMILKIILRDRRQGLTINLTEFGIVVLKKAQSYLKQDL